MGYHDDGNIVSFADGLEHFHERATVTGIKGPRRFVCQQDLGFIDQSSCNGDTLLLATRQAVAPRSDLPGQIDRIQGPANTICSQTAGDPSIDERELDVLIYCRMREHIVALENEAHMVAAKKRCLVLPQAGHILAKDLDTSFVRSMEQAKEMQQCRFAAAGWSHDGHEFSLADIDIDAFQDFSLISVGLAKMSGGHDRFHTGSSYALLKAERVDYVHPAGLVGRVCATKDTKERGKKYAPYAAGDKLHERERAS